MIAVDTNVIVRLLTRDDEAQFQLAYALFERGEVYVPLTVLLETEWVLRFAYDFAAAEVVAALQRLLGLANVHLEEPLRVATALAWHAQGLDLADALHLAASQPGEGLATFDRKLAARAAELGGPPVELLE
jgi:predicted nucleic acid-binding protein